MFGRFSPRKATKAKTTEEYRQFLNSFIVDSSVETLIINIQTKITAFQQLKNEQTADSFRELAVTIFALLQPLLNRTLSYDPVDSEALYKINELVYGKVKQLLAIGLNIPGANLEMFTQHFDKIAPKAADTDNAIRELIRLFKSNKFDFLCPYLESFQNKEPNEALQDVISVFNKLYKSSPVSPLGETFLELKYKILEVFQLLLKSYFYADIKTINVKQTIEEAPAAHVAISTINIVTALSPAPIVKSTVELPSASVTKPIVVPSNEFEDISDSIFQSPTLVTKSDLQTLDEIEALKPVSHFSSTAAKSYEIVSTPTTWDDFFEDSEEPVKDKSKELKSTKPDVAPTSTPPRLEEISGNNSNNQHVAHQKTVLLGSASNPPNIGAEFEKVESLEDVSLKADTLDTHDYAPGVKYRYRDPQHKFIFELEKSIIEHAWHKNFWRNTRELIDKSDKNNITSTINHHVPDHAVKMLDACRKYSDKANKEVIGVDKKQHIALVRTTATDVLNNIKKIAQQGVDKHKEQKLAAKTGCLSYFFSRGDQGDSDAFYRALVDFDLNKLDENTSVQDLFKDVPGLSK